MGEFVSKERWEKMNQSRTALEVIAPTVEEAIGRGLAELNLPSEAVEVEILDTGHKGLLGIGGRQARVRLTVKSLTEPSPQPEKPPATDTLLALAENIVSDMLDKMRISASVQAQWGEAGEDGERPIPIYVNILGNDLGILIGRRAEILNAFQYLANLIIGQQSKHWVRVIVDVEGYRKRRERQLRQMARRLAEQAIRTGRRQVLEPMSAAERRIIHLELRNHPSVTTESIGEEPWRKVTIIPK